MSVYLQVPQRYPHNVWFKFAVVRTPLGIISLFSFCKIHIIAKSEKIRKGVCTTFNFTHRLLQTKFEASGTIVEFLKRFFNLWGNSTVKWNVVHTPRGIFTFHMHMYFAEWKKWNNPEGGTHDNKFEPHITLQGIKVTIVHNVENRYGKFCILMHTVS